jgi:pimeloyl-ACP methyl ester carboxylesterase
MSRRRYFLLCIALLLIVLSWWGVTAARTGLVMRSLNVRSGLSVNEGGVPLLYVAPQNAKKVPGVLVAHGYAGSKQLMLGYAHVLVHAGYAVMLWDFAGHGANATPLQGFPLQQDLDVAYGALIRQPEVDPTRLALLGHSMGSGAVMSAAIRDINRYSATVAVSPTGAGVTPSAPRNLQLQAGSWEGGFVRNAQELLMAAGGENDNLAQGRGRSLVMIPNAEHITILFRDASHQAALKWLNATFGISSTSNYVDRRMIWYGLHLVAWLMLLGAVAPVLVGSTIENQMEIPAFRRWGGLFLAPFVAGGVLLWLSRVVQLQSLGGVQVGGAVGIWFFVAGMVWWGVLFRLPRATGGTVAVGIVLFILFWIAFGAMAQVVWLEWLIIPARFTLWPILSLACFPWFFASAITQQKVGVFERVAWWLGQSVVLVGGFVLVLYLVPDLGFIFLLLPLFPLLMVIFSLAAAWLDRVWSYALGSAMFFGWILAAAFPLSG